MIKDSHVKSFKFCGTACVGAKGQVVIPSKAREKFNIKEGDQLLMVSPPGKSALAMLKAEELEGMLTKMQINIESMLNNIPKAKDRENKNV